MAIADGMFVCWPTRQRSDETDRSRQDRTDFMVMTRAIANTLLVLVSLLIGLGICEFSARLMFADRISLLVDVDHRLAPNQEGTNSDGIRSRVDPNDVRAEDVNVIFLGDSFAYGSQLSADQAVPQRLERMARGTLRDRTVNVFNFGWTSSSPFLSLRLLRDIGAKYKPTAVILLVDATDFYDDLAYRRYLERKGLYALLDFLPGTFSLIRGALRYLLPPDVAQRLLRGLPNERYFAYNHPLAETRPLLQPLVDSINESAAYARDVLGSRFYLVLSARNFQYSDRESPKNWEASRYTPLGPYVLDPNRYFDEQFAHRDFPYLSLLHAFQTTTVFPTTFETDPHWNDAGSQVAADAIFQFCLERGCFERVHPSSTGSSN